LGTATIPSLLTNWITVSRLPFTTVGTVPFCAGIFIAYRSSHTVNWPASGLGVLAVFFICIACYLVGELFDQEEDLLTIKYGRSKFAGGTLLVANNTLSTRAVGLGAVILFSMAALLGLYISGIYSSWILLGLGVFGTLSAALYSLPPARLAKRGLGELFIAICYGWLTLVTGFMTATGQMPPHSCLFAMPVALSIFNVIFINEFPDYEADKATGKNNLVVHMGRSFASRIYGIVAVLVGVSTIQVWHFFRSETPVFLFVALPVVSLSFFLAFRVTVQGKWKERETLEPICGLGILLNHLASITVAVMVIV